MGFETNPNRNLYLKVEPVGNKQEEQARGQESKKRVGQKPTHSPKGISSFKLSQEQVDDIRGADYGLERAIDDINGWVLNKGIKVTLGCPIDRPGCYAVIRDGSANWSDSLAVSCWAKSVHGALVSAGYYLTTVNPDYPDIPDTQLEIDLLM